ncbi:MAG: hypothetical protein JSW07_02910, partial [bacterium]
MIGKAIDSIIIIICIELLLIVTEIFAFGAHHSNVCEKYDLHVPIRYQRIIPLVDSHFCTFPTLIYEGNNIKIRGKLSNNGTTTISGDQIAKRWWKLAVKTRKIFALRDS